MPADLASERAFVQYLASDRRSLANCAYFILETAFPHPEHPFAQDLVVATNVLREALGLPLGLKPGDIDLLLVPEGRSGLDYDRAMAVEVKIVRPTVENPDRNANSFGRGQVSGLLRDGFPFVGLLHVVMPEPLPDEHLVEVPHIASTVGPNGELVATGETSKVDLFPIASANRQQLRLLALDVPEGVAFAAIGVSLSEDGSRVTGNTHGDSRQGTRNPGVSGDLLQRIARYIAENDASVRTTVWHKRDA